MFVPDSTQEEALADPLNQEGTGQVPAVPVGVPPRNFEFRENLSNLVVAGNLEINSWEHLYSGKILYKTI